MFYRLSPKEFELMELFWDAGEPLGRQEILERAARRECSWKPNSVHILVNSLLEKGALRVAGLYQNSRKLGRIFEPSVTLTEYEEMQVELALWEAQHIAGLSPSALLSRLSAQHRDASGEKTA